MPECSLSHFAAAYIAAALWSSFDDEGDPLDSNYDESDIAPETLAKMKADCREFFIANETAILCDNGPTGRDGSSQVEMAGHDFWLTRCGHGAGFWDGNWPEPHATTLTAAARAFGGADLYVGDDGKIYA